MKYLESELTHFTMRLQHNPYIHIKYVPKLCRMGSFTSTPKILNNDDQDKDLHIPSDISRKELLQYCRMQTKFHSLLKRTFRKKRSIIADSARYFSSNLANGFNPSKHYQSTIV